MSLIDLPQAKWGSGTGRQVILKGDFHKIEQGVLEGFQLHRSPVLDYVDSATIRVNATGDCKARVILCGFPSPLAPGLWVDGGLSDGRYRENATPVSLNFATPGNLWGNEKSEQWYCIYARAGGEDIIFSLKGMPVMRVASQANQVITLRNCANATNIGYGFNPDELADGQILVLSGAARGLVRPITANNNDNGTAGTITYGGGALTLAQGDWFIVLPPANFRYLGMVFNDSNGNMLPFFQSAEGTVYLTPRPVVSGPVNGYTAVDLGLLIPPTARRLSGYAAATAGYDVKLALSYDGSTPALILHGVAPAIDFQGVRGAIPFRGRVLDGNKLYFNNDNTANQSVEVTGWRE